VRLFVGSPAEVSEERSRLKEVVDELNVLVGGNLDLRLELLKWETHARPGFGSEPQAVIDSQVGDDYEIFMGILWTKFGTPTTDAGSGTEHEFQKAYSRYKANPDQVSIMFYFKDAALEPSKIDSQQLLKVEEFKTKLGGMGSLYWTYKTTDEFVNLARIHLGKELQTWSIRVVPTQSLKVVAPPEITETGPELGFFDLLEIIEDGFKALNDLSERMGAAVEKLGEKLRHRATEINQVHTMDQSSKLRYLKRVADGAAQDMQAYCEDTEPKVPELGDLYRRTTSALARAVSIAQEFGGNQQEGIAGLSEKMGSLVQSLFGVRSNIQSFREIIKNSPRTTSAYIAAQKRTINVLGTLDKEFEEIQEHTKKLLSSLNPSA
jgi:hypothetical protein